MSPTTRLLDSCASKGELGCLPPQFSKAVLSSIDETKPLLVEIERAIRSDGSLPADLRNVVRSYNRKILAYTSDQIIPIPRPFGGRWFDDFTVPRDLIRECSGTAHDLAGSP